MSNARVKSHTRVAANGVRTHVKSHYRQYKPGQPRRRRRKFGPRHAWKTLKKAGRAGRRKKKGTAAVLGLCALAEMTAWLTVEGLYLALLTGIVLAVGGGKVYQAASRR